MAGLTESIVGKHLEQFNLPRQPGDEPPASRSKEASPEPPEDRNLSAAFDDIPEDLLPQPKAPVSKAVDQKPPEPDADAEEVKKLIENQDPPKEHKAWAKVKHQLSEVEKENLSLKSRIEELQTTTLSSEERVSYEDRIKELEEELGRENLTKSPAFKAEYDGKKEQNALRFKGLLQRELGYKPEDAEQIYDKASGLGLREQVNYLAQEAPELHGLLANILLENRTIDENKAQALTDWRAKQAALSESQQHTQKVQTARQLEETLNTVFAELADTGNVFFKPASGNSPKALTWNENLGLTKQAVKRVMLENKYPEVSRLVALGHTADKYKQLADSLAEENARLHKENKELIAAKPGVRSAPIPPASTTAGGTKPRPVENIIGEALAGHYNTRR